MDSQIFMLKQHIKFRLAVCFVMSSAVLIFVRLVDELCALCSCGMIRFVKRKRVSRELEESD